MELSTLRLLMYVRVLVASVFVFVQGHKKKAKDLILLRH